MDDSTLASNPGGLHLSESLLRRLRPDLFGFTKTCRFLLLRWLARVSGEKFFSIRAYLAEQLQHGDSRAAVVMTVQPLRIAAYTDELDCVAILRFDEALTADYRLAPGDRLLSVNTYGGDEPLQEDLMPGPATRNRWTAFHPLIADFLTLDTSTLAARKQAISEEEWQRTEQLGKMYLELRPGIARDGRPMFASKSAHPAAAR